MTGEGVEVMVVGVRGGEGVWETNDGVETVWTSGLWLLVMQRSFFKSPFPGAWHC